MADQRTMAELLCAPTKSYAEEIVVPPIPAEHFKLKHSLINLVTLKQFFGFEKEDPHAHIRYFNKITSTLKYKYVPESSIKLMLFPFSIDGPARIWLDKEPSHSILTWDDLDLLRACPHHGFTELHQLDTFYNGLNPSDQDSLNYAVGGNLLERSAQDVLKIIENKSKVRNSRNKPIVSQVKASNVDSSEIASAVTSAMTAMFKQHQVTPAPASVKDVEESCVTCGGAHSYRQCPATDSNIFQGNTSYQDPIQQTQLTTLSDLEKFKKTNEASMQAMRNHISNLKSELRSETQSTMQNQNNAFKNELTNDIKNMMASFFQMNTASSSGSLPSIPLLTRKKLRERDDHQMMKFLQIFQSLHFNLSFSDALLYMPKFASTFKNLVSNKEKLFELVNTLIAECLALADLGASINLMPLFIWRKLSLPKLTPTQMILELANRSTTRPTDIAEDVFVRVGKTTRALIDVYGEELTLRVSDKAITFKVGNTSRYSYNDAESINQIDVIDIACEDYSQEVLGFSENSESGNPTLISKPIIAKSSPSLTPFEGGDFILEEIEACFASDSVPPGIDDAEFDLEGDIRLIEEMLNKDPYSPLPLKDLKCEELKSVKSSVDEPPEIELKDLPSHLEYAFLEGTNKLPIIIAKNLKDEEKERLIKVLKSHKQAIA
ncbi:reverse transcriptase domain-containing protein [Tanacetum coccineum]